MSARVPLDVDLEDRLLYGLTPTRLIYLVIALLAAFSAWSGQWAPAAVRATGAAMLGLAGVVAAWGRWRGRPVDALVVDITLFVRSTYHVEWHTVRR